MTAQSTSLHSAFLPADGHTGPPLDSVTAVTDRCQRGHRAAVAKCEPHDEVAVVMDRIQRDHSTAVTRYRPHRRVTPAQGQVHRRLASHPTQRPEAAQPNISATSPEAVPE